MQEGAISRETYYHNLEQGELTIPGRTFQEEQHAILSDIALATEREDVDEDEELEITPS